MQFISPTTWRLSVAGIALSLATCDGLDTFHIGESSESVIPKGTLLEQFAGDLGFGGFLNMDLSQNQELKNQGVEKHQVDSVYMTALTLTITSPAGSDFTFIDELEFYVASEGLPTVRIAHGGPFTAGEGAVSLELDDVDLAPYVTADSMNITSDATGRRPAEDTTIRGDMAFAVDVNVGGALCGE